MVGKNDDITISGLELKMKCLRALYGSSTPDHVGENLHWLFAVMIFSFT